MVVFCTFSSERIKKIQFALLLFKELWYKYILCRERDYSYTRYQTDNLLSSLLIFCACWPFPGTVFGWSTVRRPAWERLHTHGYVWQLQRLFPCTPRANFRQLIFPKSKKSWSGSPLLSGIDRSCEQLHVVQACATTGCVHMAMPHSRLQIKKKGHRFSPGGCISSYFKVWQTEVKVKDCKQVVKLNNPDLIWCSTVDQLVNNGL